MNLGKLNPVKIFKIVKFLIEVFKLGHEYEFWNQKGSYPGVSSFQPDEHPMQNMISLYHHVKSNVPKQETKNV